MKCKSPRRGRLNTENSPIPVRIQGGCFLSYRGLAAQQGRNILSLTRHPQMNKRFENPGAARLTDNKGRLELSMSLSLRTAESFSPEVGQEHKGPLKVGSQSDD